jgi:hypothetical protein
MGLTGADVYGGRPTVVAPQGPTHAAPPTQRAMDASDPHDKNDPGPVGDWFEDPVIWLVLIAGLATGALGVRFRWWGTGAEVGARVNIGDELTTLLGTTLYSITGIVIFKIIATKVEVPGLQKLAAAI